MDERKDREKAFHDDYFSDPERGRGNNFYSVCRTSEGCYQDHVLTNCAGREILEYGCGRGSYIYQLAEHGARVTAIDISAVAIQHAEETARRRGITGATFRVMDAESLEFADNSFDMICGEGILHHLDLDKALREIVRVLRPGGTAVFTEPLGHNPLINLYRARTPDIRTADEHPLLMRDLDLMREYFGGVDTRYFHLQSLAAVPLHSSPAFPKLVGLLEGSDQLLFKALPFMRRYAWQVVLALSAPKKATVVRERMSDAATAAVAAA